MKGRIGQVFPREALAVAGLFALLVGIFLCAPLLRGEKLLPVDIAYQDPFYAGHTPPGMVKPHNVQLYDQAYQFYPWRVYAERSLAQGYIPFWNPYIYCGAPFMAKDQPALFYPLNLISYLFPAPDAVLFTVLARLWIAAVGSYAFIRLIGGTPFGALFGAISFAFSGFMVVFLGHPHTNVAAWLPAMFAVAEWLYQRTDGRRAALLAVVVAMQLTGGHTETALYTLAAGGLYYLFRLGTSWNAVARSVLVKRVLWFAIGCTIGIGAAAIHLLPFWEWLQSSSEFHLRQGEESLQAMRPGIKYALAGLVPALVPNVFNNPTWPGQYKSFWPGWNLVEQTIYVGILGLALAASAVALQWRKKAVLFFVVVGIVALGAALRVRVFDWINALPLFNIASPGRFRVIYTFSFAVLAGLGAQQLESGVRVSATVARTVVAALIGAASGAAGAIGVVWFILTRAEEWLPNGGQGQPHELIAAAFRFTNVALYWPVLVALGGVALVLALRRGWVAPHVGRLALLSLAIVDLFALGMGYHGTVRAETVFPSTPALEFLQQDGGIFRVTGLNVDFMPNTSMVHAISDARGLDFPRYRYQQLCEAMGGQEWLGYGLLFSRLQPRMLGLLNVKYIISSIEPGPRVLPDLQLRTTDGDIRIYENRRNLPRAFMVYRARLRASDQVISTLLDPTFDVGQEIVLEKSFPADVQADPDSQVEVTHYEPNRVTIRARTATPGFLFMSDSYAPEWKAMVDGQPAEIYEADYVFRAVHLGPGEHTVEFRYEPVSFRVGLRITLAALLVTALLALAPVIRKAAMDSRAGW